MNTAYGIHLVLPLAMIAVLASCGGSGSSTIPETPPVPPSAPALDPVTYDIRQLVFSWAAVADADYYRLLENPDGASGFSQVGDDLAGTAYRHDVSVLAQDWQDASYLLQACNTVGCTDSAPITATESAHAIGYFKASNTEANDTFGFDVALSGDGMTLAAGARDEDSAAIIIGGDAGDNSAPSAGAAYVFFYNGVDWLQQAYIKASNTGAGDEFGRRVAISQDGNTLAIAAHKEDSDATTIDGDTANDNADAAGAVYIFTRSGSSWNQQAYLKASNAEANDNFGYDISLSADGNTLAVGAIGEDNSATGVINDDPGNVAEGDNSSGGAGAAYVFINNAGTWTQKAYFKASDTAAGDSFGYSVALSGDGATLAVGAIWKDGNEGAAYVYRLDGGIWSEQDLIKPAIVDGGDFFGRSVSLSHDGNTLAVGADGEASNSISIDNGDTIDVAADAGAAYVFSRSGAIWTQQAYIKAPNTGAGDHLGHALDLSSDGNILAVGAANSLGAGGEDSAATGIGGAMTDNSTTDSGAAYLFHRTGTAWTQGVYVKASNTGSSDAFGASLSLSDDGQSLVIGAFGESSATTGIGGNQTDNSAGVSGAAYLY